MERVRRSNRFGSASLRVSKKIRVKFDSSEYGVSHWLAPGLQSQYRARGALCQVPAALDTAVWACRFARGLFGPPALFARGLFAPFRRLRSGRSTHLPTPYPLTQSELGLVTGRETSFLLGQLDELTSLRVVITGDIPCQWPALRPPSTRCARKSRLIA